MFSAKHLFFYTLLFMVLVNCAAAKQKILPENCGSAVHKREAEDNLADLGEFPWLVRLKYGQDGYFACNGFIIHERFILTAAQCLAEYKGIVNLTKIEVGEHDADKGPDCVEKRCAPDVQAVDFDTPIEHPSYDKQNKEYDIALVPLKKAIKFTEYIAPVCLTNNNSLTDADLSSYTLGGWGRTPADYVDLSTAKQKFKEPLFDFLECQKIYENLNMTITDTHLCAAGEHTCASVSGAPLMYLSDNRWHAVGVVSFGVNLCQTEKVPTVYTNIHKVEDWILDSITKYLKK